MQILPSWHFIRRLTWYTKYNYLGNDQFLRQSRFRAVLVGSGFVPRACGSLTVFQTVRMTPFTALIKLPQLLWYVASFEQLIAAGFPEARRDQALAVLGIHPSDSHALCQSDFWPRLNPTAYIQLNFLHPNAASEEVLDAASKRHCNSVGFCEQTGFTVVGNVFTVGSNDFCVVMNLVSSFVNFQDF